MFWFWIALVLALLFGVAYLLDRRRRGPGGGAGERQVSGYEGARHTQRSFDHPV